MGLKVFRTIRPQVWLVAFAIVLLVAAGVWLKTTQQITATTLIYLVQPVGLIAIAFLSRLMVYGRHKTTRHADEKTMRIISLLAVWFVVYSLSGLIFTYVSNVLVASPRSIAINIWSFGGSAVAVEYIRHRVLSSAGRRSIRSVGLVMTLVLALPFMDISQIPDNLASNQLVEMVFTDFVGSLATSAVLTYLAINAGLRAQLVYRIGLLAIVLLPPVIPKHDWYMIGMAAVVIPVAVYLVLEKFTRSEDYRRQTVRQHDSSKVVNGMFFVVMVVMVMFMTGVFTYKPLVIMSNSMVPVFSRGSVVVVQKINAVDIRQGDIVQYESSGKMVTHRVVDIKRYSSESDDLVFTTQGDNSPSKDKPVRQNQIVGVVRGSVPFVGYPTVWLQEIIKGRSSV